MSDSSSMPPRNGSGGGAIRESDSGRTRQVRQLFNRLVQEIEEKNPANVIFFIVDFLFKHYPQNLAGFANIWNGGTGKKQGLG